MFTPKVDEAVSVDPEAEKERHRRRHRDIALSHAVALANAAATNYNIKNSGVTAEYLLDYASKLAQYLDDGTVPQPAESAS